MATFSIDPSRVDINMLFGGQGKIHPQLEDNAFTFAHAFKHIKTLACPLPSC